MGIRIWIDFVTLLDDWQQCTHCWEYIIWNDSGYTSVTLQYDVSPLTFSDDILMFIFETYFAHKSYKDKFQFKCPRSQVPKKPTILYLIYTFWEFISSYFIYYVVKMTYNISVVNTLEAEIIRLREMFTVLSLVYLFYWLKWNWGDRWLLFYFQLHSYICTRQSNMGWWKTWRFSQQFIVMLRVQEGEFWF